MAEDLKLLTDAELDARLERLQSEFRDAFGEDMRRRIAKNLQDTEDLITGFLVNRGVPVEKIEAVKAKLKEEVGGNLATYLKDPNWLAAAYAKCFPGFT